MRGRVYPYPSKGSAPEADHVLAVAPPALERLGRHVLRHLQVRGRGLQVLPKGEDVDACTSALAQSEPPRCSGHRL